MASSRSPALLIDGPEDARLTVALAHGAGGPMDHPFMAFFALGLAARGYRVARFEFPYMRAIRETGLRRPPDPTEVLLEAWRRVIAALAPRSLVIGGKSLGGRMASLIADDAGVLGLVCLGYPFHPPQKPEHLRIAHLRHLQTPTLVVQGERDPFGSKDEVEGYALSPQVRVHWLADGDHGFRPRSSSGRTEEQNWGNALAAIAAFLGSLQDR